MTSYRFCRSDDIPLLVEAYNRCYRPHFAELPELTVDGFKALIRSHDLWTSSCMVAQAGDDPAAVLFSAKREEASLIYCIGVHADHQKEGHGRHLLTSLSQKLAILGPSTLRAEIRSDLFAGRALLEATGYRLERTCPDYRRDTKAPPPPPGADALIIPVTREELQSQGVLDRQDNPSRRPWLRDASASSAGGAHARGLAVVSDARLEAWVLYAPVAETTATLVAFGAVTQDHRIPLLRLLLDRIEREYPGGIHFPTSSSDELPAPLLSALGFEEVSRTAYYTATASPA